MILNLKTFRALLWNTCRTNWMIFLSVDHHLPSIYITAIWFILLRPWYSDIIHDFNFEATINTTTNKTKLLLCWVKSTNLGARLKHTNCHKSSNRTEKRRNDFIIFSRTERVCVCVANSKKLLSWFSESLQHLSDLVSISRRIRFEATIK